MFSISSIKAGDIVEVVVDGNTILDEVPQHFYNRLKRFPVLGVIPPNIVVVHVTDPNVFHHVGMPILWEDMTAAKEIHIKTGTPMWYVSAPGIYQHVPRTAAPAVLIPNCCDNCLEPNVYGAVNSDGGYRCFACRQDPSTRKRELV